MLTVKNCTSFFFCFLLLLLLSLFLKQSQRSERSQNESERNHWRASECQCDDGGGLLKYREGFPSTILFTRWTLVYLGSDGHKDKAKAGDQGQLVKGMVSNGHST